MIVDMYDYLSPIMFVMTTAALSLFLVEKLKKSNYELDNKIRAYKNADKSMKQSFVFIERIVSSDLTPETVKQLFRKMTEALVDDKCGSDTLKIFVQAIHNEFYSYGEVTNSNLIVSDIHTMDTNLALEAEKAIRSSMSTLMYLYKNEDDINSISHNLIMNDSELLKKIIFSFDQVDLLRDEDLISK